MAGGVKPLTYEQMVERFRARLVRAESGCLEFAGAGPGDYGRIRARAVCKGLILTHRLAWELAFGPVPAGQSVLHRCDNRPCCEPTHLFLGDQAANLADMVAKGRQRKPTAAACGRGHQFTGENTYVWRGRRQCRQCRRQADRRARRGEPA